MKTQKTQRQTNMVLKQLQILSLLIVIGGIISVIGFGIFVLGVKGASASNAGKDVVGVWYIKAVGAPFQPHIATFDDNNTMMIDNPEAGDTHTSDSMGMGPWEETDHNVISGKFEEINANRSDGTFNSNLIVTYTITVTGDTFTGPAEATYYDADGNVLQGPFPATLNGTRVTLH